MKTNILISLIILLIVSLLLLFIFKRNENYLPFGTQAERYQPDISDLPDDVVIYSILKNKKDILSFKDLVRLALTNRRYYNLILRFVRQLTGVQNLKDLQHLKFFFGVPRTNKERNISKLNQIFQVLNPVYLKLIQPSDRSDSLIVDYSNLPVVETTSKPANWGFRYISPEDDFKVIIQKEGNKVQTKRIGIYLTSSSNPEFEERMEELIENLEGESQIVYRQNQQTSIWEEYAKFYIFSVKSLEFDSSDEGIVFMLPSRLSSNEFDLDDEKEA